MQDHIPSRCDRHAASAGIILLLLTLAACAPAHLASPCLRHRDTRRPLPAGQVDDASRLNAAQQEVVDVAADTADAERQLVELVRRAAREGRKVSIAGARHTMGGHTIYP